MLNKGVDEVLFDPSGKAWGIKTGNEVAKANLLIGDPSYFPAAKSRVSGLVVRSICILDHPIAGTDNSEVLNSLIHMSSMIYNIKLIHRVCFFIYFLQSVQIIIPASTVKRKNDIYVCMVSTASC